MSNDKSMRSEATSETNTDNRRPNRRARRANDKSRKGKKGSGYKATPASNDFSWHAGSDASLLERASQISWAFQAGEAIQTGKFLGWDPVTQDVNTHAVQPGIMVIRDQIAIGGIGCRDGQNIYDMQNLPSYNAAVSLLTTMRSRARIRNTYDAPDVFILNNAMANLYGGVALAKRLAATVNMFTYQNDYMPRMLIRAQGFNPDWFLKNQFQFVTELNTIISEINKVYVPNRMHLFQLVNERFSNYYTEGDSIKDQLYVITPAFLNVIDYNPNADYASRVRPLLVIPGDVTYDSNTGGIVGSAYNRTALHTGTALLTALRQMLNAVLNHDSTADITGDMENCFGASERFILSPAEPSAIAMPVFDEEILETIHNMSWSRVVSAAFEGYSWRDGSSEPLEFSTLQRATDNRIGTYDYFSMSNSTNLTNLAHSEGCFSLLDVHKDPNPQKTFAITRLRNVPKYVHKTDDAAGIQLEFSTDIICDVEMYWFKIESNGIKAWYQTRIYQYINSTSIGLENFTVQSFHYRPMQFIVDGSFKLIDGWWVAGETDIYAQLPALDDLRLMNRLSLLSLLGAYNNV